MAFFKRPFGALKKNHFRSPRSSFFNTLLQAVHPQFGKYSSSYHIVAHEATICFTSLPHLSKTVKRRIVFLILRNTPSKVNRVKSPSWDAACFSVLLFLKFADEAIKHDPRNKCDDIFTTEQREQVRWNITSSSPPFPCRWSAALALRWDSGWLFGGRIGLFCSGLRLSSCSRKAL